MVSPGRRASRLRLLPTGPLQSSPSRPTTIPIRSFQRRRYGRKTKRDDRSSWRIDARVISRSVTMGSSGVVFSTRRRRARASSGETKRKETKRNSQSHTSGLVDDHITIVRAVSSLSRARVHAVLLTRLVPFTFETRSLSNRERSSPVFRAEISKPRRRARGNRSRVTSREDAHVRPTHSAPSRRFSNRSTSRSRGTPRHTGGVSPATPGSVRCLLRPRNVVVAETSIARVDGASRRRCVASRSRAMDVRRPGASRSGPRRRRSRRPVVATRRGRRARGRDASRDVATFATPRAVTRTSSRVETRARRRRCDRTPRGVERARALAGERTRRPVDG